MDLLTVLFFLALGFSIETCNASQQICNSDTGHREYYDEIQVCCNGIIRQRNKNEECCAGDTIYNITTHQCCADRVVARFRSVSGIEMTAECSSSDEQCREQICCKDIPVDKENTVCCDGKPIRLSETQMEQKDFLGCCGESIINELTHFCCNGSGYPRASTLDCCGQILYDQSEKKCLTDNAPEVVEKYEGRCGSTKYDTWKKSCCSGVLNSLPEMNPQDPTKFNKNLDCCDSIAYDNTKNKCCRESHNGGFTTHIIPNEENIHCCGEGFYDTTREDCYNGTVLTKVSGKERCGFEYIDGISEGCCGDDRSYRIDAEDCCMGETFNIIPKSQNCCNGEGIEDNQICCNGILPCNKLHLDDKECCYNDVTGRGTTYNSNRNEYCVNGEIMTVPPGAEPCARSYYYPDSQICCGGRVEVISSGYDQCCGDKLFNSKSQQCCNDKISNIPPTEGNCCMEDNRVYRFEDKENPCRQPCGNMSYDNTRQICCEGTVHALHDSTICCGSSAIDSHTTRCCGGQFPYSRTGHIKCCGRRDLFSDRSSKCRNEKVVPLDPVLRNQTDVQRLCYPTAVKHFDGGAKYACESLYVAKARLTTIQISEKLDPKIIYITMLLTEVKNLNRGENFPVFSGPENLNFTIEVPNNNGVQCRRRYLDRCCHVIIFFNARVKNGRVKISGNSKFFMTAHSPQRERLITKQLSYQFCRDKFNMRNKPI